MECINQYQCTHLKFAPPLKPYSGYLGPLSPCWDGILGEGASAGEQKGDHTCDGSIEGEERIVKS